MTAWWTDMSTTGNIMPARLPVTPGPRSRLRRLRRCRCRLRRGAASAADRDSSKRVFDGIQIGDRVTGLRFKCTGRWPVHFFGEIALPVAALVAAAAPVCASAESAAPTLAVQTPRVVGQNAADFYRGPNDYPLWLAGHALPASRHA